MSDIELRNVEREVVASPGDQVVRERWDLLRVRHGQRLSFGDPVELDLALRRAFFRVADAHDEAVRRSSGGFVHAHRSSGRREREFVGRRMGHVRAVVGHAVSMNSQPYHGGSTWNQDADGWLVLAASDGAERSIDEVAVGEGFVVGVAHATLRILPSVAWSEIGECRPRVPRFSNACGTRSHDQDQEDRRALASWGSVPSLDRIATGIDVLREWRRSFRYQHSTPAYSIGQRAFVPEPWRGRWIPYTPVLRADLSVDWWEERGFAHVIVVEAISNQTIWRADDEDVASLIENGFIRWDVDDSVVDYVESLGIVTVVPRREWQRGYDALDVVREPEEDVVRPGNPYEVVAAIRVGLDTYNVFQQYWRGQSDPLYTLLSRRPDSVDVPRMQASREEVERLYGAANDIIDGRFVGFSGDSHDDEEEHRMHVDVARATLERLAEDLGADGPDELEAWFREE